MCFDVKFVSLQLEADVFWSCWFMRGWFHFDHFNPLLTEAGLVVWCLKSDLCWVLLLSSSVHWGDDDKMCAWCEHWVEVLVLRDSSLPQSLWLREPNMDIVLMLLARGPKETSRYAVHAVKPTRPDRVKKYCIKYVALLKCNHILHDCCVLSPGWFGTNIKRNKLYT